MPKIRSVKERYEIQERCLRERLEQIVPVAMERSGADIWLHISREYNEDPTFRALFPPLYPTARRLTILAFVRTGEGVRRFHLSMPDEDLERFYEHYWTNWRVEPQMAALTRLFEEYNPEHIAVNRSQNFAVADGLSAGCDALLREGLDEHWISRMYADDTLPLKVMELRTPTEMELMPEVADVSYSILEEMYTPENVKPGVTTTQDLEFFMRQRTVDLGLEYWFEPTMDIERAGVDESRITGVIQEGDLLHCDFGIRYMNMMTDSQRLAYVPRTGEHELPRELVDAMAVNNRFQDIVRENMVPGRTGNEVFAASLAAAKAEGIDAMLYSHPCNMYGHGPGPTIGLWSNQGVIPVHGDVVVDKNTCWALELNVQAPAQGREKCFIYTEETVLLDSTGVHFLHEGRDQITFIA